MTFLRHLNPIGLINRRDFPGSLPVVCRGQRSRRSVLLAESHRFDVPRRVDVSIMGRPTRDTGPLAVGKGQLGMDMAAIRAHLGRGLKPTNHLDVLTMPLGLILDLAAQLAPTSIHDRPVHGATPRGVCYHVRNRQILDTERGGLVLAHQMTTDLVEVVVTDVGNGFVSQGNPQARLISVLRSFDFAEQAALSDFEPALVALQGSRVRKTLAVRGDDEVFEAEIEAESPRLVKRRRGGLYNAVVNQHRGVEFASGRATDCGRLDLALEPAIETAFNSLFEAGNFDALSDEINRGVLRELIAVVATANFEPWKRGYTFEESRICGIKIAKGALESCRRHLVQPFSVNPLLQFWQVALKLVKRYTRTGFDITTRLLCQRPIVDPTSTTKMFPKQLGLSWCGIKTVFVGAKHGYMELHGLRSELYKNR